MVSAIFVSWFFLGKIIFTGAAFPCVNVYKSMRSALELASRQFLLNNQTVFSV